MDTIEKKTSTLITDTNNESYSSIKKILTLEDAVELVSSKLKELKNVKKLCLKYNLCYRNVLDIKQRNDIRYPLLVKTLLKLLYDLDVDISQIYILKED